MPGRIVHQALAHQHRPEAARDAQPLQDRDRRDRVRRRDDGPEREAGGPRQVRKQRLEYQPRRTSVNTTAPIASSRIGRRFALKSRQTVKNALDCSSGGRNSAIVRAGSSVSVSGPGVTARTMPPTTKAAAGGMAKRRAINASTTALASSSRTSSKTWYGRTSHGGRTCPAGRGGKRAAGPPPASAARDHAPGESRKLRRQKGLRNEALPRQMTPRLLGARAPCHVDDGEVWTGLARDFG